MTLPDRFADFDQSPWIGGSLAVLGAAQNVPTMLSHEEALLYFWLTSKWARGVGAIVDLGCFVGGSTARFAAGAKQAGLTSDIHTYDRFGVSQGLRDEVLYPAGVTPFEGNSSLPAVRELLAPWAEQLTFHKGDIEDNGWIGEPIEILAMDASKSTASQDQMARDFFPHLIPGQSVVIHQDFLHWRQPWIAAQMALMAECFVPLTHVTSDTIVFGCIKPITPDVLARGETDGLDDAELIDAVRAAAPIYAEFGEKAALQKHIQAIERSPNERISWKMVKG
ncbi:MAG: hypothetical protein ACRBCL_16745 [Maritimibacter sp.]